MNDYLLRRVEAALCDVGSKTRGSVGVLLVGLGGANGTWRALINIRIDQYTIEYPVAWPDEVTQPELPQSYQLIS